MLIRYKCFKDADMEKLLLVYAQSVGDLNFRNVNAFSEDLRLFFNCHGTYLAQWMIDEEPVAAMRVEPYRDGYLISCLETALQCRRRGYASALMRAVMAETPGIYYAHVDKRNKVSLRLHDSLGFQTFLDHAVHVDGSVYSNSYTLKC